MNILFTTQAVDLDDPTLGFAHRWIEEIAKRFDHVHVVCLKEGRHALPKNVVVHSLGKENGPSRIKYVTRFYRYIVSLRGEYDAVFVHMNPEYVVLGGLLWRLAGKRVVLWRNHVLEGFSTWIAAHLANVVCYTSPKAYTARFKNARQMPIGIDTDLFASPEHPPLSNSILFFGRLDEVKHPDVFVSALERLRAKSISFHADIVGDPTESNSAYAGELRERASPLVEAGLLAMVPAVAHSLAPDYFRSHAVYVNITPSGSFDKTIGEAAACGCVVVTANEVLRGVVSDAHIVDSLSPESVADGIASALSLSQSEQKVIGGALRAYVVREHSLSMLVEQLMLILRP